MFSFSAGWHLGTGQAWFSTTPCPLSIHLRWCHFAWVQTTARGPGSSQPSLPLLQSYLHSSLLPKQLHTSHCSWLRHSHKPRVKEQLFSCQPSAVQRFPSSPHRNVLLLNPCTEQGAANEQDAGREQGFLCSQHKHSLAQLSVPAPHVGANG